MSRRPLLSKFAPWIAAATLWVWLFVHLQVEWSLNPQYNYGWAVPFLALLMFWFRWQRRPAPHPALRNNAIAKGPAGLVLLLLFPLRIVEEANPDWRLLSWLLALCVIDFSLLTLFRAAGRDWLKHFAFPVFFPLAAVPWPAPLENFVVQTMMRAVAYVAVEIAGWFGVGAYQLGNVIQLRNGFVGVDEACSGVKTLQAGIMVALVLGELLQLRWNKRIALLVLGCGWVFVCNVFRATALVFVAANSGLEALGRWHDWIGTAALLCGMAGLLGLAWLWKGEPKTISQSAAFPSVPRIFPSQWLALGWLALIFAGTEIWYRSHERQLIERPSWQVDWPAICLPAIGRNFQRARADVNVRAGPVTLDFRSYEFEQNGQPLFVFVCIQEDKRVASGPADTGEWNFRGRLRAALDGKRNLGQRLLEIAILGLDDFSQASEALSKTAEEILRPEKPTG
jgi:exosortase